MRYVDDPVLADMARKLQNFRDKVMEESEKNELTIKYKKTEILAIRRTKSLRYELQMLTSSMRRV